MIQWNFIARQEGVRYVGYVPDPKTSKSGVTVGCGVDIGHMTDDEFNALPVLLQNKIEPYRHLVGRLAIQKINSSPLMLDTYEVNTLNQIIFDKLSSELREDYNRAGGAWDTLTDEQQTCIMSVAFQYGVLAAKTPKFWKDVVTHDWDSAIAELENFGDDYGSRRIQEANLLRGTLS